MSCFLCCSFYHFVGSFGLNLSLFFTSTFTKTCRNKLCSVSFVKCTYILTSCLRHLIWPSNRWFLFWFVCFHSSVAEILQTILLKGHLLHWFYNFIVEKSGFIIYPQLNNMKVLLIFSYSTTLYWLPHKVFWESLMQFVSLPFWDHKFFRWSHLKFFTSFQTKYWKT